MDQQQKIISGAKKTIEGSTRLNYVRERLNEIRQVRSDPLYIDSLLHMLKDKMVSKSDTLRADVIKELGEIVVSKMYGLDLDSSYLPLQIDLTPKRLKLIFETLATIATKKPTSHNIASRTAAIIVSKKIRKTFRMVGMTYETLDAYVRIRTSMDEEYAPKLRRLLRKRGLITEKNPAV
ncbi:MAG: hypothetical protein ABR981_00820 [Candidatus Micrarchaeaceae archaeon]